ncbi:MAG: ribonuclease R [Proteobacteria bacterium]|nr:ribonuclease R [Pseudomonadota bacterium]
MKKELSITPITKDFLLKVFKLGKKPMGFSELEKNLHSNRKDRKVLKATLNSMLKEGSIIKLKNKRYGIPYEMNLQTGTLFCTRSGNGFLIPDKKKEKGMDDIFIPARFMENAFHGDKVIARIEHTIKGKKEGKIIKITERRIKNITGFIRIDKDKLSMIPDDERIRHNFIISKKPFKAHISNDDLAAARITRFPEEGRSPECSIIKVFKGLNDISTITQFIRYKHGLPLKFKKNTEAEAKQLAVYDQNQKRVDLRSLKHITIDGEFAKDFDDAVCVEKSKKGYTLYVSIADVSYYVLPGTSLDNEAFERGTSIYFPKTVIPMLPKILSNVICSLNPQEDRLSLTVRLNYNNHGDLLQSSFHQSIIKSMMRLTYNKVEAAIVNKDLKARKEVKDVLSELEWMKELATLLAEKRERRGNLDFDLPEPEVTLDIEGGITSILRSERLFSQRIIEEFMIAANEAVAQFLSQSNIPAIYRVHEPPEREKLYEFERLLHALTGNYSIKQKSSLGFQSILNQVKGSDYEYLINRVLLKSMKQAKYASSNKGHFGLASDCYLHFTSPIRRYPDLICHRSLKNAINGSPIIYNQHELDSMATHLSERERLAMESERESEDRIRILFMKDKIGEVYNGIISHITSFGFFVELFDLFVEGLVLLTDLYDDYYLFQEEKFRLIGRRTKKIYRIGDKVWVKVVLADVEKKQLHFKLMQNRYE